MKRALVSVILALAIVNSYQCRTMRRAAAQTCFEGRKMECAAAPGTGLRNSLRFGLNYELLREFGSAHRCEMDIVTVHDSISLCDSLLKGIYDIAILKGDDTLAVGGIRKHPGADGSFIWATRNRGHYNSLEFDRWLAWAGHEDEDFMQMAEIFGSPFNPAKRAEAGLKSRHLSPYDDLIRKYARTIGWNWKMLAALIYSESKFTINNVSPRGAVGLMQVMPSAMEKFGCTDPMDPEENIRTGTALIDAIQTKYLGGQEMDVDEREKFVLASYNAGAHRIAQCRSLASENGLDDTKWENAVRMMDRIEGFDGGETVRYVDYVLSIYDAFCTICPWK